MKLVCYICSMKRDMFSYVIPAARFHGSFSCIFHVAQNILIFSYLMISILILRPQEVDCSTPRPPLPLLWGQDQVPCDEPWKGFDDYFPSWHIFQKCKIKTFFESVRSKYISKTLSFEQKFLQVRMAAVPRLGEKLRATLQSLSCLSVSINQVIQSQVKSRRRSWEPLLLLNLSFMLLPLLS